MRIPSRTNTVSSTRVRRTGRVVILITILVSVAACNRADHLPSSSTATALPAVPTVAAGPHPDWLVFRRAAGDLEFRYPQACTVKESDGVVSVGSRIQVEAVDSGGVKVADYVQAIVDRNTRFSDWSIESQEAGLVNGVDSVRIQYRFGGVRRFGEAVFLERRGKIYIWQMTAGGFSCDEPSVFEDIVSSFRLTS